MSKFFDNIEKMDVAEMLSEQLKMQVDVPWPEEVECLEKHGLSGAKNILDVGTGNGYFLAKIAESNPDKYFIGIESNAELVNIAKNEAGKRGLKNIRFIEGRCPCKIDLPVDFVMARLSVYGMPKPDEYFTWVHEILPSGSRTCIIDVDDSLSYSYPPDERWNRVFVAVDKKLSSLGGDRAVGRKLPYYLLKSGFNEIKFELKFWYSSVGMGKKEFLKYWRTTPAVIHKLMPEHYSQTDMNDMLEYLREIEDGKVVTSLNPIAVASGRKP